MQTPGTALIVVIFTDGTRLAFEADQASNRLGWFAPAMKEAGQRIVANGRAPFRLVVIDDCVANYNSNEIAELTGVGS